MIFKVVLTLLKAVQYKGTKKKRISRKLSANKLLMFQYVTHLYRGKAFIQRRK
ncbi:hypothetical protein BACDOR_04353 [Phocaeicola dorei DSM 17855]|uniref:Uncharacterized protein n=1 Tax=Phocaeicola dorei DSM 17855 TaxID=483217 RepID=B6W456_9BACT|nr:hypothetical protein BACDOR_04353 [Phocaeicola dorei DSM 17855]